MRHRLSLLHLSGRFHRTCPLWAGPYRARPYSSRTCPDLRILFCGSDNFSATSLKALQQAKDDGVLPIKSMDVLCRPPKRTGRGLKVVREVPIVDLANQLGLPTHKIDTFKGWDLPTDLNVNLIIAVSFGLLIPARLIQGVRYGGLNVHPSLLPDFRGAAPIEHAMFEMCTETGVSLQTLHPTKFDHGALLRQTRAKIDPLEEDFPAIKARLADQGAELLVDCLKAGDFVQPYRQIEPPQSYSDGSPVQRRKAPKITPEDSHVDWIEWSVDQTLVRQKVLGPLWTNFENRAEGSQIKTRVKWTGGFKKVHGVTWDPVDTGPTWRNDSKTGSLLIPASDGTGLEIDRFTIAGKSERTAKEARAMLKVTDENQTKYL